MRHTLISTTCLAWISTALVGAVFAPSAAVAADLKLQAILVWGTDDAAPPAGKDYKPVDRETLKKLQELPLKWSHWFEVNRTNFTASAGPAKRVAVSQKCELEIAALEHTDIEVVLIGKGKEVVRRKQSLSRGELLALGGNAPNSTAWLVILKRME